MLCPNCNQPVDAASTYCSHCGCTLPKEEPPTQTAPNGLPSTNTMDINAELRKAEQKEHGFADMFYKAEGRLNRKPYILRVLVLQVVGFCLQLMGIVSGAAAAGGFGWQVFCFLIVGIPSILLLIRRLHDLGRTGWLWLLIWIPVVNFALVVYAFCFKGTTGPNRFGPDPLA